MQNNTQVKSKAFTLVEVLISALILSITVFGILRLSANNTSQTNVIEKNKEMIEVMMNTRECAKSFGYDYLNAVTGTQSINFGSDDNGCFTGTYDANLSFTSIKYDISTAGTSTRPNEYWSFFEKKAGTSFVTIDNTVTDGTLSKKTEYKIYK